LVDELALARIPHRRSFCHHSPGKA
jgi:hypothetical protein